jgi:putative SOS response-associated peptidase YedK
MCGRYTLATPVERLAEEFGFDGSSVDLPPNYNVAPTQEVAAVLAEGAQRRLEVLRWASSPRGRTTRIGSRMINARAETASEKPSFRRVFRERRYLIPSDGFYKWRRVLRVEAYQREQATLLHPYEGGASLRLRRSLGELER